MLASACRHAGGGSGFTGEQPYSGCGTILR